MIKCQSCQEYFTPTEFDQDRLVNAIKSKMPLLIINCTQCNNQNFIKTNEIEQVNNKKIHCPTTNCNDLLEINKEKKLSCQSCNLSISIDNLIEDLLPDNYFKYLIGSDFKIKLHLCKEEEDFNLYNLEQLKEEINIDGELYFRIGKLKGFFNTLKEVGYEFSKKEIELFENALAIGDENGDVLFIDKREDNSKLYIFYPDGGDIEKTKLTINDIIKRE